MTAQPAVKIMMEKSKLKPAFKWEDPLLFDDQLTDEERIIQDSARAYAQDKLLPRVI